MSYVNDLLSAYATTVSHKWETNAPHPQRVWMAVYRPDQERRIRLHLKDFATKTQSAGYAWADLDITNTFETWIAGHEYRDEYFANPELLEPALSEYFDSLVELVRAQLSGADDRTVVGLVGAGAMYGLGDQIKLSALLEAVSESINGRLLVFFPGEREGNNYRLLGARDGWNYLAIPISADGGAP